MVILKIRLTLMGRIRLFSANFFDLALMNKSIKKQNKLCKDASVNEVSYRCYNIFYFIGLM